MLILDALDELLSGYTVIHQTGEQHFESCRLTTEKLLSSEEKKSRYHLVPFFDAPSLHTAYTQADIVISRAGSTSIYEIALHGKPSILIPIPEEISHDQRTNAYTYARTSNAVVLEEGNLTPGLLRSEIDRIMGNENLKRQMSTGAQAFGRTGVAEQIRDILIQIGQEH